ncbi:transposable element Tcb2 transposase [Trichonephila clavipes]|nr:transposable element Tcb2 transposase [Trichonephila clavipes]
MRVWKQWIDEHRTTRKTGSGRRKVTSVCDDRHLLHMVVNDRTVSSRQLAARWSTATGVLISTSSIRRRLLHHGLRARQTIDACTYNGLKSTEPGKLIGTKLSFQMNHVSIFGTMIASFVLGVMPVNVAFHSALSNDIVALHPELWFGERFHIMDDLIFYELRDNAHPHVAKTIRDFCSAQHMQLLPWPTYLPDMSPIEHVWDLVGWRLARDTRAAASKDELLLRIEAIWNSLSQANIQNLFDSMSRRKASLIAACGGYTKY